MTDERIGSKARQGLGYVEDEFDEMMGGTLTEGKGKLTQARRKVQKTAGLVKDAAADRLNQVRDGALDAYDQIDDFLRERPLVGVGIGFALGALVGVLISETRNRD